MVRLAVGIVLVLGLSAGSSWAGQLNPPPGPVAPTPGPEPRIPISAATTPGDANSVFRITAGGSYYLTGDLLGQSARHGIEIAASDVTLDLMGFSIIGVGGALTGINVEGSRFSLEIRNGRIFGFPSVGMHGALAFRSRVRDLMVTNCGSTGIVLGNRGSIEDCMVDFNQGRGISVTEDSRVVGCRVLNSGTRGVSVGGRSQVIDCLVSGGTLEGISVGAGSLVRGCKVSNMGSIGIRAVGSALILECVAESNAGDGIRGGNSSLIRACLAVGNTGDGIFTPDFTRVQGCTVMLNGGDGIQTVFSCEVSNCYAYNNGLNGIVAGRRSNVVSNTSILNGNAAINGAGILIATGSTDAVVDSNRVFDNDLGILVPTGGNLIIRNTAANNSVDNYSIVINNRVGVTGNAPSSPPVVGSAGGAGVGTTDPWGNVSF